MNKPRFFPPGTLFAHNPEPYNAVGKHFDAKNTYSSRTLYKDERPKEIEAGKKYLELGDDYLYSVRSCVEEGGTYGEVSKLALKAQKYFKEAQSLGVNEFVGRYGKIDSREGIKEADKLIQGYRHIAAVHKVQEREKVKHSSREKNGLFGLLRKLSRSVAVVSIVAGSFFLGGGITGNVIGGLSSVQSNSAGAILFIIGVVIGVFSLRK